MIDKMTPQAVIDRLETLYNQSVANLRDAVKVFLETGERADIEARANGLFSYPKLTISWFGDKPQNLETRAFGRLSRPGIYTTTITRPDLFRNYLLEQLTLLADEYDATFEVGPSDQEIPFPYVLDGSGVVLDSTMTASIARWFPTTDLAHIGDEISDGLFDPDKDFPLSQFDGLRTDFSLARLRHYTGTPVEAVQSYILFTNYNRYVDEFVRWAAAELKKPDSPYDSLTCAGGVVVTKDTLDAEAAVNDSAWRKHQMPAYHLTRKDGQGITLVNIGVGPSNAKTICDHLAVMRPHVWMMIGHCGGLRGSQTIGDYVLAHAYLRDDHVLDAVLPADIPVPSIAEVQRALYDATKQVSGAPGEEVKKRLRTGTVVTTDDRNWNCAIPSRPCASTRAARSLSTWNRQRSRLRVIASACPTAPCSVCRTSRCMARSSCRGRLIASMRVRFPNTFRSVFRLWNCCVARVLLCTRASCVLSTSRRSVKPNGF